MCENKYVMGLRSICCVQQAPHEREQTACIDLPKYFLVENEIMTRGEGGSD